MSPARQSSGASNPAGEPDPTQPEAAATEPEAAATEPAAATETEAATEPESATEPAAATGPGPLADLVSGDAKQWSGSAISDPVREVFAELAADMPPEPTRTGPTLGPKAQAKADRLDAASRPPEKRGFRPLLFVGALVGAAVIVLLLAVGAAYGLTQAYAGKVVPGVKVGTVDVSGLDRAQVMAKLAAEFANLGEGKVTIATPIGTTIVTYSDLGRAPDTEVMADAALSVGHSGSFLGDAAVMARTVFSGQVVPVVVKMDPAAIATRLRALVGTTTVAPKNASVSVVDGKFTVAPSSKGRGVDEAAVASSIIETLSSPDAPAGLEAKGAFVDLAPQFDDQDAEAAIEAAGLMAVNVNLTWGGDFPIALATPTPEATAAASGPVGDSPAPSSSDIGSPSPVATAVASPTRLVSPTPTSSPIPTQTFMIPAATIHGWILFDWRLDGTYGPMADPALIHKYLDGISAKVRIKPIEPRVITDSTGKPVGLESGANGADIDYDATIAAIQAYLAKLAGGSAVGSGAAIVMRAVEPTINSVEKLDSMVVIGAWTTTFYPNETNGFGVNIRLPAKLLNGQVVAPGQEFTFFNAVGPIDPAHGWTYGGVIVGGKSDHTGAMGGGICSASTTMFNAAARAGLKINERHAHFYYINRYPSGLDATVYSNGVTMWDLKWTNDTPYPIVIRGVTTGKSTSRVTFELWSLPINRTVLFNGQPAAKFTGGKQANTVKAGDITVYVSTLAPGQKYRAEYPTDGFDTTVRRVVTDSTGATLWQDTWNSKYRKVDGILQVGAPLVTAPAITSVEQGNAVLGRKRKSGPLMDEELAG
jgi:vancomycin resistance protein YoaR